MHPSGTSKTGVFGVNEKDVDPYTTPVPDVPKGAFHCAARSERGVPLVLSPGGGGRRCMLRDISTLKTLLQL